MSLTDADTGTRSVLTSDAQRVQLFTGEAVGRTALAVEPMACPPDAFRTSRTPLLFRYPLRSGAVFAGDRREFLCGAARA